MYLSAQTRKDLTSIVETLDGRIYELQTGVAVKDFRRGDASERQETGALERLKKMAEGLLQG